jgi:hypothetical protein
MHGGTINGNTSDLGGGGVLVLNSLGTFTMTGGSITGNTSSTWGGGVMVLRGTFTKTGGTISGYSSDPINGNVVKSSSGVLDSWGHAVYAFSNIDVDSPITKHKEFTAGPTANLAFNGNTGTFSGAWEPTLTAAGTLDNISLSWDVVSEATLYRVFRSTNRTGPFGAGSIVNTAATQFEDGSIPRGIIYYYQVAAYNSDSIEIARSAPAAAQIEYARATLQSSNEIKVEWLGDIEMQIGHMFMDLANLIVEALPLPISFSGNYASRVERRSQSPNGTWTNWTTVKDPSIGGINERIGITAVSNMASMLNHFFNGVETEFIDGRNNDKLEANTLYEYRVTYQLRMSIDVALGPYFGFTLVNFRLANLGNLYTLPVRTNP